MATLMPGGKQTYFDNAGDPLAGGLLYTYAAGTDTPLATYSNKAGSIPNTNPVVLNSRGEATVFWGAASYKVVLHTSLDVPVWTQDDVDPTAIVSGYAPLASPAFTGTPTGLGPSTITATGSTTARTLAARAADWVWARDFGVTGDGVTDDTAALAAAFAASYSNNGGPGKPTVVPEGTYLLSAPVSIGSNQTIILHGKTTFLAKPGGFPGDNDPLFAISGQSNVTILGNFATLKMQKDEYTSGEGRHGISIYESTNVHIENLNITDTGGDGVAVSGPAGSPSQHVRLTGLAVSGVARNGLSIINAVDLEVDHCSFKTAFKGAGGAASSGPWAGIDIEPDFATYYLRNIRIHDVYTSGNANEGILLALYALDQTSFPVDVQIRGWTSYGDGTTDGSVRTGLRATGAGSSGVPATKAAGSVLVEDSMISVPLRQGVRIDQWYDGRMPLLKFRNVQVTDCRAGGETASDDIQSAFTVVAVNTDAAALPVGGIEFESCVAQDNRSVHVMRAGFYLNSSDATRPIQNILFRNPTSLNQTVTAGPIVARGGQTSFTVRYDVPPHYAPSSDVTLLTDWFGYQIEPAVNSVMTIPARATWGDNEIRFANPSGVTFQVRPAAGESIALYGLFAQASGVGDMVFDRVDAYAVLGAHGGSLVVKAIAGRTRPLSFSKPPVTVYGTAAPTTQTWAVGDRVIQITPVVGQPKSWVCTVAGTPGTWVSEGNL